MSQARVWFGFTRMQAATFAAMLALIVAGPFLVFPVFLMKVLCFAIFALGFNLLLGFAGLMSFGHAAYFGMGAYFTAWLVKAQQVEPLAAIAAGGLGAALLGAAFGAIAIRRQGIYFAMITLALAQMIYFFCVQAPFTRGEDGIQQIPRGALLGLLPLQSDMAMYWAVAGIFVACFLFIHRVIHSPFGQALRAIREHEARAMSLGYPVNNYKLIAFILSALVAGIAGGTKALVFGIATLTDVHFGMSGEVVFMSLIGGLGTIFGPVAGALVTISMEHYLAEFGAWITVLQGLIFMACVLAFRRGIVGELGRKLRVSL